MARSERFSIALFNTAVALSAVPMLWLLWHFPLATAAAALLVVAGVALAASLTETMDAAPAADISGPKPTA